MPNHHVILVPGFFGFGKFGELTYFNGVREALEASFAEKKLDVTISEVATLPTASIRHRAALVLEALAAVADQGDGPIHIVGHSTGGLDARLAIAPTASLPTNVRFTAYDRIRTVVTVCCPHFGTPVATFFSSAMGKPLLRMVARYSIWVLRRGRAPLVFMLRLGYFIVRLRDPFRKRRGTFDELYEKLLNDFSEERRLELIRFLEGVSSDQWLMFQLTPAGCDLLNACTADPKVRYGSVVARARRPTWRSLLGSIRDLYTQIMHPVYAFLHRVAARGESLRIPAPVAAQRDKLLKSYGELPSPHDSDGMVPTHSQIWGELVHAASADHLDVVGQFGRTEPGGWSGDWIPSYSSFGPADFQALWGDIAAFIAQDTGPTPRPIDENLGTERTERDLSGPDVTPLG
jgi:triacylglycerol lipase